MSPRHPIDRLAGEVIQKAVDQSTRSRAELAGKLGITPAALSLRFTRGHAWPLSQIVEVSAFVGQDILRAIGEAHNARRPKVAR